MKRAPKRLTTGQMIPRKVMNFWASSSLCAAWNIEKLENDDKTRDDRPRSDKGTESDRVGYSGNDNEAKSSASDL